MLAHLVVLPLSSDDVLDRFYHGTDPDSLDSVLAEGLKSVDLLSVHLSGTLAAAREVGSHYATDRTLLEIDVEGMVADGVRLTKRGEEIYTADEVSPEYVSDREP